MVVYGIRYLLETYLHRQWTIEDVEKADKFYRSGIWLRKQLLSPGYTCSVAAILLSRCMPCWYPLIQAKQACIGD